MIGDVALSYRQKIKDWTENRPFITAFLTAIAIGTGWFAGSMITGNSFSGALVGSIVAVVTAFIVGSLSIFFRR
jgi:hypothetical protein